MKKDFFEKIYYHPSLTKEDYKEIARAHHKTELPSGTMLLEEGKIAREFYVIERGLFRSFVYDYNGNEVTTGFFCQNEILIESLSLFQRLPSKEYFQAVSGGTVWKIRYEDFDKLLNSSEGLREWGGNWATTQLFSLKQQFNKII